MHTLLLLPWMAPHKVIPWQRAIVLSFLGKVEVVVEYDEVVYRRAVPPAADPATRSPSLTIRAPAVVRMRRAEMPRRGTARFCRDNVFRRDGFACQYCGAVLRPRELTFDHVLPRARGGRTDWDNIVTCCRPCNDRKRDRTPEEAGMKLARRPTRASLVPASGGPGWLPPRTWGMLVEHPPAEWEAFVA